MSRPADRAREPVIEKSFQHILKNLRVQIETPQRLSDDGAWQLKEQLPGLVACLYESLEELQSIAEEAREIQLTGSSGSARSNGHSAIDATPSSPTNTAGDAAERKIAEQDAQLYQAHMRSMIAELLLTEENERRSLAVDVHDGLSQTIALTQIKLEALRESLDGKLTQDLDEIVELVSQTDQSTRSIGFELSPPALHDLGLEPAVQWLVENIQSRYDVEVMLEDDGKPKLADHQTRVILFRSIRELLINAAKHSGAQRVQVRLLCEEEQLNALVEDDGVGMEPEAAVARGSGLFSIRERLRHVGGSMHIESAPGIGTKIRLCAPLGDTDSATTRLEA